MTYRDDDGNDLWAATFDPYSAHNWNRKGGGAGMNELLKAEAHSRDADPDRNEREPELVKPIARYCYVLNRDGQICQSFYSTPVAILFLLLQHEPIGTINCKEINDDQAVFSTDRDPVKWPRLYSDAAEKLLFGKYE